MANKRSTNSSGAGANNAGAKAAKKAARRTRKQDGGGPNGPPVSNRTVVVNRGPRTQGRADGSVLISNSEFVTDLNTQTTIQGFDLNPMSASVFTWLARVAVGYELFRFTSLEFVYTPVCSSATSGVVVMAFDYDASDAPPPTKQAISAYAGSVRGNVWAPVVCRLNPPSGWFFVAPGGGLSNPAGTDLKFYDAAKFYIGLFNWTSASLPVGELTVRYTVEFSKPDFGPPTPLAANIIISGSSLTNPAGTAQVTGNIPVTVSSGNKTFSLTFQQAGQFAIETLEQVTASAISFGYDTATQTDPLTGVVTPLSVLDSNAVYSSPGAMYYALQLFSAVVTPGTVLTFTVGSSVTAFVMTKLRLMSYQKSLN